MQPDARRGHPAQPSARLHAVRVPRWSCTAWPTAWCTSRAAAPRRRRPRCGAAADRRHGPRRPAGAVRDLHRCHQANGRPRPVTGTAGCRSRHTEVTAEALPVSVSNTCTCGSVVTWIVSPLCTVVTRADADDDVCSGRPRRRWCRRRTRPSRALDHGHPHRQPPSFSETRRQASGRTPTVMLALHPARGGRVDRHEVLADLRLAVLGGPSRKFICGEPMNPATNRLTGLS